MNLDSVNNAYENNQIAQLICQFHRELPEFNREILNVAAKVLFQHRENFNNFQLSLKSIIPVPNLHCPLIAAAEKILLTPGAQPDLKRKRDDSPEREPKRQKIETLMPETGIDGNNGPLDHITGLFQALWNSRSEAEKIGILRELCRLAGDSNLLPSIAAACNVNIVGLLISQNFELAAAALSLFAKLNGAPANCKFCFLTRVPYASPALGLDFKLDTVDSLIARDEFRYGIGVEMMYAMLPFLKPVKIPLNGLFVDLSEIQQQALRCLILMFQNCRLDNLIKALCSKRLFSLVETTQCIKTLDLAVYAIAILMSYLENGEIDSQFPAMYERGWIMERGVSVLSDILLHKDFGNIDLVIMSLTRLIDSDNGKAQDFSPELLLKIVDLLKSTRLEIRIAAMAFFAKFEDYHDEVGIDYGMDPEPILSGYIDSLMFNCEGIRDLASSYLLTYLKHKQCGVSFVKVLVSTLKEREINPQTIIQCLSILDALREWLPPSAITDSLVVAGLSGSKALNLFPNYELRCNGKKIGCDKNILATHSSYFLQLFTNWSQNAAENFTILRDIDAESLELAVQWMYGEIITCPSLDVATKLLRTADFLEMGNLRQYCIALLERHLALENAADILNFSLEANIDELQHSVLSWMMLNLPMLTRELYNILADKDNIQALCAIFVEKVAPKLIAELEAYGLS